MSGTTVHFFKKKILEWQRFLSSVAGNEALGPRVMSQLWDGHRSSQQQGKQLGEDGLNPAVGGRAEPRVSQQYPHTSQLPCPEQSSRIFGSGLCSP